jgi:hypothetical protein
MRNLVVLLAFLFSFTVGKATTYTHWSEGDSIHKSTTTINVEFAGGNDFYVEIITACDTNTYGVSNIRPKKSFDVYYIDDNDEGIDVILFFDTKTIIIYNDKEKDKRELVFFNE